MLWSGKASILLLGAEGAVWHDATVARSIEIPPNALARAGCGVRDLGPWRERWRAGSREVFGGHYCGGIDGCRGMMGFNLRHNHSFSARAQKPRSVSTMFASAKPAAESNSGIPVLDRPEWR